MQNTLKEGKLQFGDKSKPLMQVDSDPLQVKDAYYAKHIEILMVETTEGLDMEVKQVTTYEYK